MAREQEKKLYLSVVVNYVDVGTNRNQDEKNFMVDIENNEDYVNTTFTLQSNNDNGLNPKSTRTLENIESFFYLFYPYGDQFTLKAVFTKMDDSTFTLNLKDLTIMNEAFKTIELTNMSTEHAAIIKTLYS